MRVVTLVKVRVMILVWDESDNACVSVRISVWDESDNACEGECKDLGV